MPSCQIFAHDDYDCDDHSFCKSLRATYRDLKVRCLEFISEDSRL